MKCHILKELQQLLNQQENIMSNLHKLERKLQYSENSQWTQHEHHLFMTPGVKLVCEQFSLFSQILLVGVFIIQNSLIIHILFLLRKLTQRRELKDCLAFTKIQPKIQCASTKVTSRLGLLDNKSRSFQLCTVHQFNEVSKVLELYGNS
ncbi:Hypothetical_protein [Hexamita inflata]|uniref:Hypothetical_protein n=1 Tax=Hexamita inflata TaxID=28002 RepID=A0AA86NT10_9EUKA|nr:Hypothetical protein HINF_LOCUS11936 [Hexamita inflata]